MSQAFVSIAAAALALVAPAGPGQDEQPPSFSASELAASVRVLEPRVDTLKPTVRSLRTEQRVDGRTTVSISSDVLFDFDSAELTPSAAAVIADLVARIAAAQTPVLVIGHTDGIGTADYNQALSERRAAAVASALRAGLGPTPAITNITTEGRGSREPVAPETINGGDNPQGRAQNRRVEISLAEPG
jgi:OmpA-OmpF porin, OOP family